MKSEFKINIDGSVELRLFPDSDYEKIELSRWRHTMRYNSDGNTHATGCFFEEFGSNTNEAGEAELILKSFPEQNLQSKLGILSKLRRGIGSAVLANVKIRKYKI